MKRSDLLSKLKNGQLNDRLEAVYGKNGLSAALQRLTFLVEEFGRTFPCSDDTQTLLFSAPGRTELGGNHTDHQRGHCLAASVDLDTIACVVPNGSNIVRIKSQHHHIAQIDLNDLQVHPEEAGSSVSLLRGVAARLHQMGYTVGGFDAYTTTRVLRGSGLSSSAAFEVLIGTIMNHLYCGGELTSTQIAQIGQYAENVYFDKPCGLMDQLACATGGVIAIDFHDADTPSLQQVHVDLTSEGYALCIIDSMASHADLTADYAAIPQEMRAVAASLGKTVLSDVDEALFRENLSSVRAACGDRAALRAHHFFKDDKRVIAQCDALKNGDFDTFLRLVQASGRSSFMYLQNVATYRDSREQPVALLLALAEDLLDGRGACRVHGGGFAGTIQAFVPLDILNAFIAGMEQVAGKGACHVLSIRDQGSILLIS